MSKFNIIIGSKSEKIAKSILNVLNLQGVFTENICYSIPSLKKTSTYFKNGIIILVSGFNTDSVSSLIEDLYQNFYIIIIGKYENINIYNDQKVYKLCTPLKREELLLALECGFASSKVKGFSNKNELIEKAKKIIHKKYNLNEEKCHLYLQRLSMQTNKPLVEICKDIINLKGELI